MNDALDQIMQKIKLYIGFFILCVLLSSAGSGQPQPKDVAAACNAKNWRQFWDGPNLICLSPKAMRQREVAERRKAKEQRAYLRKNFEVYKPSKGEIWDFIKENWKEYGHKFSRHKDSVPIRINDLLCVFNTKKYKTDVFECYVGLLGMDGGNPSYSNVEIDFVREYYEFTDPLPKLKVFEDASDIVIIN